jgi:alpha-ketoglutarate-dependent taurine dioxygenase
MIYENINNTPFDLDGQDAWLRWREHKLANAPVSADDLIVEVKDPRALSAAEHAALLDRVRRCNMAIYASTAFIEDVSLPRELARQFGLVQLDANWLADEDGITEIQVNPNGTRSGYIPYTDRPIKWHTDGYYNPPERRIRAMVLHCVRDAKQGGENRLMDHEIAYLWLREKNPEFIRALMRPTAMTIPERVDEQDGIRAAQSGPVFAVDDAGALSMRYTARTRSIAWQQDAATLAAVECLSALLTADSPHVYRAKLAPGMGLLCNNVLHDRAAFTDDAAAPRLLYRARYPERILGS